MVAWLNRGRHRAHGSPDAVFGPTSTRHQLRHPQCIVRHLVPPGLRCRNSISSRALEDGGGHLWRAEAVWQEEATIWMVGDQDAPTSLLGFMNTWMLQHACRQAKVWHGHTRGTGWVVLVRGMLAERQCCVATASTRDTGVCFPTFQGFQRGSQSHVWPCPPDLDQEAVPPEPGSRRARQQMGLLFVVVTEWTTHPCLIQLWGCQLV